MTNAAANAALATQRIEMAMRLLAHADRNYVAPLITALSNAKTRMAEAKLPLYAAAGQVNEGKGEGQRLGNAAAAAEARTEQLLAAVRNLKDALEDLQNGEQRLQTDINVWENLLRG